MRLDDPGHQREVVGDHRLPRAPQDAADLDDLPVLEAELQILDTGPHGEQRRGQLVWGRARAKNQIHATLMRCLVGRAPFADLFGTRNMATLLGVSFVIHQMGSVIGAWGGGMIFDMCTMAPVSPASPVTVIATDVVVATNRAPITKR